MIRPFDLRDVPLVAQLENQGTLLNAELALTQKPHPLQSALASFFSLGSRGRYTYVRRGALPNLSSRHAGVVQLRVRGDSTRGYITFIAPALSVGNSVEEVWLDLIEYIGIEAGRNGVHHLIAEAPEDGDEVDVLRRAGFVIYLRQDIYHLDTAKAGASPATDGTLRACEDVDTWAIQQLYYNTAPRLAQLAEGAPQPGHTHARRGYVYYEEKGSLAAYVELRRGSHGAWLNLLVHPDAESRAARIMHQALTQLGPEWDRPIFCGVRRYQEWLHRPLESLGFAAHGSSVLMVKHLVAYASEPELALARAPALEHAKISTPS